MTHDNDDAHLPTGLLEGAGGIWWVLGGTCRGSAEESYLEMEG